MKKLIALLPLLAALFVSEARADFTAKDASAATITFKNPGTCTAVICVPVAQLYDGTNVVTLTTAGADAGSNTLTGVPVYARNLVYNGSTWDRWAGAVTNAGTFAVQAAQSGTWNVTNISGTVSLPTGAATAANQATANASLATIATNTSSPIPAGTAIIGYTTNDPCGYQQKTNLAISQNGTTSVQLVAISGSTTIYVCSLSLIAAGASTVALTTGTGSACATGNAAVIGSTTANIANSLSLAANGGLTLGNGGATVAKGAASGALCMINGSNVYISGNLTYVQQ